MKRSNKTFDAQCKSKEKSHDGRNEHPRKRPVTVIAIAIAGKGKAMMMQGQGLKRISAGHRAIISGYTSRSYFYDRSPRDKLLRRLLEQRTYETSPVLRAPAGVR